MPATTTTTPTVIQMETRTSDWRDKLEKGMKARQQIVLFAPSFEPSDQEQVEALCGRHGYQLPKTLPPGQWPEYKLKLNLTDLAVKEQGIQPNTIYLLEPGGR